SHATSQHEPLRDFGSKRPGPNVASGFPLSCRKRKAVDGSAARVSLSDRSWYFAEDSETRQAVPEIHRAVRLPPRDICHLNRRKRVISCAVLSLQDLSLALGQSWPKVRE